MHFRPVQELHLSLDSVKMDLCLLLKQLGRVNQLNGLLLELDQQWHVHQDFFILGKALHLPLASVAFRSNLCWRAVSKVNLGSSHSSSLTNGPFATKRPLL